MDSEDSRCWHANGRRTLEQPTSTVYELLRQVCDDVCRCMLTYADVCCFASWAFILSRALVVAELLRARETSCFTRNIASASSAFSATARASKLVSLAIAVHDKSCVFSFSTQVIKIKKFEICRLFPGFAVTVTLTSYHNRDTVKLEGISRHHSLLVYH